MKKELYKPTHKLIKKYVHSSDEVYEEGTLAYIASKSLNIAFVDKRGIIQKNKLGMFSLFSEDRFRPRKKWFEKL